MPVLAPPSPTARSRKWLRSSKRQPCSFNNHTEIRLDYRTAALLTEQDGTNFTGHDPSASEARSVVVELPQASNSRLILGAEGIAHLPDGTFYVGRSGRHAPRRWK